MKIFPPPYQGKVWLEENGKMKTLSFLKGSMSLESGKTSTSNNNHP